VQSAKVELDTKGVSYAFERALERLARQLAERPESEVLLNTLEALATTARDMNFDVDVWQVQNIYFDLMKQHYPRYRNLAAEDDGRATQWIASFTRLGEQLAISVDQVAS
jgi:hypothetical protein